MRKKIFDALTKLVTQKIGLALIIILIITLVSGFFASKLQIDMNMASLLPKNSPMMKEFNYVTEHFPGANPMIIVLEGNEHEMVAFAEQIKPTIDTLDGWIEKNASEKVKKQHQAALTADSKFSGKYFDRVDIKLPTDFFEHHGLMLMKEKDLHSNQQFLEEPNFLPFLTNLNDNLEKEYIQSEEKISTMQKERKAVQFLDNIENWTEAVSAGLFSDEYQAANAKTAARSISIGSPYLLSPDRSLMLIMAEPTFNVLDMGKVLPAVNGLEEYVKAEARAAGIKAGLAGGMTLSRDEMVAATEDSFLLTILALISVLLLFIITFRMLASPFLALLNLLIGICWSMGVTYFIVGTLNMFTAMVSVILVGLGIDFSIHIISVFSEMREKGKTANEAIKITYAKVGAGILAGGFTTAIAFLTLTTGRSTGIMEFGLVTGISVVVVMLATLLILPAFLMVREKLIKKGKNQTKQTDISYKKLGKLGEKIYQRYIFSSVMILVVTLLFTWFLGEVRFDYNYLNMEPVGLESVKLNDLLIDKYNMSSDPTMMTAKTLQENFDFTQKAKAQSSISYVESISDYLPPKTEQENRRKLIMEIQKNMENSAVTTTLSKDYKTEILDQLTRLEANIIELQDLAFIGGQDMVDSKAMRLVGSANLARALLDMEEMIETPNQATPKRINALQKMLEKAKKETKSRKTQKELTIIINNLTSEAPVLEKNYEILTALYNSSELKGAVTKLIDRLLENENDRLLKFSTDFSHEYKNIILTMADTSTITLKMLPETTRDKFYSAEEDCFLITVYPKGNIWNIQYLESFSRDLLEITPRIAGLPPMFYYLLEIIGQDGKRAAMLTLLVVFVILLIDFRSIKFTILAMLPLISGFLWMLGIMGMLGVKLTLVNVMALPLILGIGIDDGIHMLHRYKLEGRGTVAKVLSSTGKAIMITSLTTMLSFGSLIFATYRGYGSLGIALFIGVGACFLTSIFVLPAMIRLFQE